MSDVGTCSVCGYKNVPLGIDDRCDVCAYSGEISNSKNKIFKTKKPIFGDLKAKRRK